AFPLGSRVARSFQRRMVRAFLSLLAVGLLAACSPSIDESGTSSDGLTDGRRLTEPQVQTLLTRAAFPASAIPRMVCIAKYESGFNDLFARGKPNGTWDIGLFAINTVHAGNTPGCPVKADGLYDA